MPQIKSITRGRLLWEEWDLADTSTKRFMGIMGKGRVVRPLLFVLPRESQGRSAIHSLFCVPFDAIFLDSSKRVVDVRREIAPWNPWIKPKAAAKFLIECAAGETARLGIVEGEQLDF